MSTRSDSWTSRKTYLLLELLGVPLDDEEVHATGVLDLFHDGDDMHDVDVMTESQTKTQQRHRATINLDGFHGVESLQRIKIEPLEAGPRVQVALVQPISLWD